MLLFSICFLIGFMRKKRYAYLVTCEPRKLTIRKARDGIVVLRAYMRGAAITHYCFTGFPRTFKLESGIAVPRFVYK